MARARTRSNRTKDEARRADLRLMGERGNSGCGPGPMKFQNLLRRHASLAPADEPWSRGTPILPSPFRSEFLPLLEQQSPKGGGIVHIRREQAIFLRCEDDPSRCPFPRCTRPRQDLLHVERQADFIAARELACIEEGNRNGNVARVPSPRFSPGTLDLQAVIVQPRAPG